MNKTAKILFFVLALQVGLVFLTHRKTEKATIDLKKPLLSIAFDKVDRIILSGLESNKAVLFKEGGIWKSDEYFGFPLSQDKIESLFLDLKDLKMSWPVGKTLLAAKQFSVTKEKFEKKLDFFEGGELLGTVYLGTSPSFRKSHIRVEGEENTYAVKFSSYEYQVKSKPWIDRRLYRLEREKVDQIKLSGLGTLSVSSEGLHFSGLTALEEVNEVKTQKIFNAAINPAFNAVVGKNSYEIGSKVLSYELKTKEGALITYDYYNPLSQAKLQEGEESSLILKVSAFPFYFEVNRSEVQDLVTLKRSDLVRRKDLPGGKESASLKGSFNGKKS